MLSSHPSQVYTCIQVLMDHFGFRGTGLFLLQEKRESVPFKHDLYFGRVGDVNEPYC